MLDCSNSCGECLEIEFQDLTKYYHHPPSLKELQGETDDRRRKEKGEMLFIIAAYHDNKRLAKMLDALSKQGFKRFDVAIIYAKDDKFLHDKRLSIIHIKRKTDLGFAGAIYLGQLVALKYRYKYYMATDVDKYPYSEKSIALLYDAAEKDGLDYVRGRFVFSGGNYPPNVAVPTKTKLDTGKWFGKTWPFLWGLTKTRTLEKIGLYPLPLYLGADDCEYDYRLARGHLKKANIDAAIFSTYFPFLKLFERIKKDGVDNLYHYATLFSIYNMPQIYMQTSSERLGVLEKIEKFAYNVILFFLRVNLAEHFFEARDREFLKYRKNAGLTKFSIVNLKGMKDMVKIKDIGRMDARERKTELDFDLNLSMAGEFLNSIIDRPGRKSDRDILFSNSVTITDYGTRRKCLLEWKKPVPIGMKLVYIILSILETIYHLTIGLLNMLFNRHLFDKYGLRMVENNRSR